MSKCWGMECELFEFLGIMKNLNVSTNVMETIHATIFVIFHSDPKVTQCASI